MRICVSSVSSGNAHRGAGFNGTQVTAMRASASLHILMACALNLGLWTRSCGNKDVNLRHQSSSVSRPDDAHPSLDFGFHCRKDGLVSTCSLRSKLSTPRSLSFGVGGRSKRVCFMSAEPSWPIRRHAAVCRDNSQVDVEWQIPHADDSFYSPADLVHLCRREVEVSSEQRHTQAGEGFRVFVTHGHLI